MSTVQKTPFPSFPRALRPALARSRLLVGSARSPPNAFRSTRGFRTYAHPPRSHQLKKDSAAFVLVSRGLLLWAVAFTSYYRLAPFFERVKKAREGGGELVPRRCSLTQPTASLCYYASPPVPLPRPPFAARVMYSRLFLAAVFPRSLLRVNSRVGSVHSAFLKVLASRPPPQPLPSRRLKFWPPTPFRWVL